LVTHQLDRQLEAIWEMLAQVSHTCNAEVAEDDLTREGTILEQASESDDADTESDEPRVVDSTEVLVLLEDRRPVGIAYRRPRPDREWPWRIKLNLAQWLER
jgi:hypothetical protein